MRESIRNLGAMPRRVDHFTVKDNALSSSNSEAYKNAVKRQLVSLVD